MQHQEEVKSRVRERQWIYLGPIAAAPIAHICVTLYRDAKTPRAKQLLFGVGIVGSTVATVGMRLYLMHHAGYPGGPNTDQITQREKLVTASERKAMESPSVVQIAKEAARGLGWLKTRGLFGNRKKHLFSSQQLHRHKVNRWESTFLLYVHFLLVVDSSRYLVVERCLFDVSFSIWIFACRRQSMAFSHAPVGDIRGSRSLYLAYVVIRCLW